MQAVFIFRIQAAYFSYCENVYIFVKYETLLCLKILKKLYITHTPNDAPPFPTDEGYFIFETMKHIDGLTLVWCFVAAFNYIIPSILVRWQKELSQLHDRY